MNSLAEGVAVSNALVALAQLGLQGSFVVLCFGAIVGEYTLVIGQKSLAACKSRIIFG